MFLKYPLIVTAIVGVFAAILVGTGEYLLHFDPMSRFASGGYEFMLGISASRTTIGHFLGVLGAALYPVGCYHIYLMLRPANNRWAFRAFLISSFGFMVGAVWIGSRASISALVQLPESPETIQLIELYELRYETLLQIIRLTTLILSAIIIWLAWSGRSHYPRWMVIVNPIVLIVANFILFALVPAVGKHTMPIALNVAFLIFFSLSLCFSFRAQRRENTYPISNG